MKQPFPDLTSPKLCREMKILDPNNSKGEFLEGRLERFWPRRKLKDATSNQPRTILKKTVMYLHRFASDVIVIIGKTSYNESSCHESAKASFAWSKGRALLRNLAYNEVCMEFLARCQRSWSMVMEDFEWSFSLSKCSLCRWAGISKGSDLGLELTTLPRRSLA